MSTYRKLSIRFPHLLTHALKLTEVTNILLHRLPATASHYQVSLYMTKMKQSGSRKTIHQVKLQRLSSGFEHEGRWSNEVSPVQQRGTRTITSKCATHSASTENRHQIKKESVAQPASSKKANAAKTLHTHKTQNKARKVRRRKPSLRSNAVRPYSAGSKKINGQNSPPSGTE